MARLAPPSVLEPGPLRPGSAVTANLPTTLLPGEGLLAWPYTYGQLLRNSSFPASNARRESSSFQPSAACGIQPSRNPPTRKSSARVAWGLSTVTAVPLGDSSEPPADCTASAKLTVRPSYAWSWVPYPSSPNFGASV